jgi:PadR family transcriptional regulator PadR
MASEKSKILQGPVDLMVMKTLASMGPLHGYGIARRIEQISEEALQINQGTIYSSLVRLMQRGWISGAWGTSDNNRKAKFYSITKTGRKQLSESTELGAHLHAPWRRAAHRGARITECLPG